MKIITLIASHIDSKERLNNFIKLLESIRNQTNCEDLVDIKKDEMDIRISLSHDLEIQEDNLIFLFNIINPVENKNKFKFYLQNKQFSQFEHYKFLVNKLYNSPDLDENNTWILFSDDDDMWSQTRFGAYSQMINSVPVEDYETTTAICYVDTQTKIKSYAAYCIKLKYLKIFFKYATKTQIKHKYCDSYLIKFISLYGLDILKIGYCESDEILYEWLQHDYKLKSNEKFDDLYKILKNGIDLFMAKSSIQNCKEWINFCNITKTNLHIDVKRDIIKFYLDNYENHIFSNNNLPIIE